MQSSSEATTNAATTAPSTTAAGTSAAATTAAATSAAATTPAATTAAATTLPPTTRGGTMKTDVLDDLVAEIKPPVAEKHVTKKSKKDDGDSDGTKKQSLDDAFADLMNE